MSMSKSKSNSITADQILAAIKSGSSPSTSGDKVSDIVVDYFSDSIDTALSTASRIGAAFATAGKNAGSAYKIERSVQQVMSDQRLQRLAERAAVRINAAMKESA